MKAYLKTGLPALPSQPEAPFIGPHLLTSRERAINSRLRSIAFLELLRISASSSLSRRRVCKLARVPATSASELSAGDLGVSMPPHNAFEQDQFAR
jgi:hypothetical protein